MIDKLLASGGAPQVHAQPARRHLEAVGKAQSRKVNPAEVSPPTIKGDSLWTLVASAPPHIHNSSTWEIHRKRHNDKQHPRSRFLANPFLTPWHARITKRLQTNTWRQIHKDSFTTHILTKLFQNGQHNKFNLQRHLRWQWHIQRHI